MDNFDKIIANISNNYDVIKLLKRNERGTVSIVREKETGKRFVFRKFYGKGEVYKKLINVSCKNLPEIIKTEESEEATAVIEEYIFGDTLFDVLRGETLSKKETIEIAVQICEALEILHKIGAVHRDVKPENIIIRGNEAVLIDFDAARIVDSDKSTDTQILGTTGYASPEQYGLSQTDARSDIYSLGVVINVMLTGEHPSRKLVEGTIGEIVQKCTMINPDMRYQSAEELKRALVEAEKPKKNIKKSIAAAFLATVLVLGIAAGFSYFKKPSDTDKDIIAEGFCGAEGDGTNLEWKIDSDYVLTISGTGRMADYDTLGTEELVCPWKDYKDVLLGLVIEEGVESIGTDAFRFMNISEDELVLPKSLVEIGAMAFCKNNFSGELVLPEGLEIIKDNAFQAAGDFTFAFVPSTVEKIFDTPFRYCGLEEIIVAEDNPFYCSYDGALFTHDMKEIIQFPENVFGTYNLPESVEIIGDGAFEMSSLNEIIIDGNIKRIDGVAFQFYPGKVIFNGKVEEIKDCAFNMENGRTKVYFFGGAPKKVSEKMSSKWYSFVGNVDIFYLKGTSGWEKDSDGLWNGYTVFEFEPEKSVDYIEINDIGPARGDSMKFVPDFYDYWKPEEIITENIKIAAPGNLEKYINYKFSEDVLTFTIGKIPEEEWEKAVDELSPEENLIFLSIIVEAPNKDVVGLFKHNGNGPTYSNLKRQEQSGAEIEYCDFDPSYDRDWTGFEMAAVIREEGKITVAPIERESVFYAIFYWKTENGEIIRQILPYEIKIGNDFEAVLLENNNYHKNDNEASADSEWLDVYWEPVSDPKRAVLRTLYYGREEREASFFEENGLSVKVFEKPGLIDVSLFDRTKIEPELVANSDVFLLPPDAKDRKNGESISDWIERVYEETEYVGFKLNAGGISYVEDIYEEAKTENDIINAGYFYPVNDKNTCCLNFLVMDSVDMNSETLWYTIDYEGVSFMIIDWYTENPEENPNAKPKKREYITVDYESFSILR